MIPGTSPSPSPATLSATDVLIVGGGIVGCSAAYYLAREGVEVVLIEREYVNCRASGRNAGGLHLQLTSPYIKEEDPARVKASVPSLMPLSVEAIATWRELSGEVDCEIDLDVAGGLMLAETARHMRTLERKSALERSGGLEVHVLSRSELRALAPYLSDRVVGAEFCPAEGRVNPLLATAAIARGAEAAGARIRCDTDLVALHPRPAGGFEAETSRGRVLCNRVINAAGAGSIAVASMVGVRLPGTARPQQMMVTERTGALVHHMVQHADSRLTMKQAANGTIIIGGGWPAAYEEAGDRVRVLRSSIAGNLGIARQVVPALADLRLVRTWTGIGFLTDGNPILGPVPGVPGYYNAVPANGGYTTGPICARLLAEELSGRRPTLDLRPFSIERF